MKTVVNSLVAIVAKHWLRIAVLMVLFFVVSKKQIDLNIQFGKPVVPVQQREHLLPSKEEAPSAQKEEVVYTDAAPAKKGWLQKMNILGTPDYPALTLALSRVEDQQIRAFLNRFADVARTEQQKFGIPSSITLANALLFSRAGTAPANLTADNIFQLSCTNDWLGPTSTISGKCYRKYENAWTSFRDHSLYLTTGRYSVLTQLSSQDYHAWANGLEALEFNDTPQLATQLEQVIEEWQLYRFD